MKIPVGIGPSIDTILAGEDTLIVVRFQVCSLLENDVKFSLSDKYFKQFFARLPNSTQASQAELARQKGYFCKG